jgi:hypothetical protein
MNAQADAKKECRETCITKKQYSNCNIHLARMGTDEALGLNALVQ